jgi:hypothetical protein
MLTYADVTELGAHACSNCPAKRAPDEQRIFCGCIPGTMAKNEESGDCDRCTSYSTCPEHHYWAECIADDIKMADGSLVKAVDGSCRACSLLSCPRNTLFTCFTSTLFTCFTVARARSCRAHVLCLLSLLVLCLLALLSRVLAPVVPSYSVYLLS